MSELSQNNTKNGKLLPCPFCGGEAKMHYDANGSKWVACENRECEIQPYLYRTKRTEAEAITAWNSRAERTCHINELDALTQTLSMVNGCSWGECSECGCLTPTDSVFCVECGAKVVGE
jgi:Lar family restriction alleviation protein